MCFGNLHSKVIFLCVIHWGYHSNHIVCVSGNETPGWTHIIMQPTGNDGNPHGHSHENVALRVQAQCHMDVSKE